MDKKNAEIINDLQKSGYCGFELINQALKNKFELSKKSVFEYLSTVIRSDYLTDGIVTLLVKIGELYSPSTVFNPTCGIGRILSQINYSERISGIDINNELIEIAKHFNNKADISKGDFSKLEINQKYDQIILTPPFGIKIDFKGKKESIEKVFIKKSLDLLDKKGILITIVPNSLLFSFQFEELRKEILSTKKIESVIELNNNSLNNTGILASVLVIKNELPSKNDKIFFGKYDGDCKKVINDFINKTGYFWVDKIKLSNRLDRSFYDPEFSDIDKQLSGIEVKKLEEIAELIRGVRIPKEELYDSGNYLVMSGKNIRNGKLYLTSNDKYINEYKHNQERALLKKGDIVVNLIFSDNKIYVHNSEEKIIVSSNCAIIRATNLNLYLSSYISSIQGNLLVKKQIDNKKHGAVIPSINMTDLRQIKIPIVPLDDPNRIVNDHTPINERYSLTVELLQNILIKKGWEIKSENRVFNISLDIGLYRNGELVSFLEIKSPSVDLERIKQQVSYVMEEIGVTVAFIVRGSNIYRYTNKELVIIDELPTVSEFSNYRNITKEERVKLEHDNALINLEKMVSQLVSQNKELMERTKRIETTVGEIKDILISLQSEFEMIKQENRDDEEKLMLLCKKIDRKIFNKNKQLDNEIDEYADLAKSLINNWVKLEPLSKEYYPVAEYLFSKLQTIPNVDFSPVILQYCRTMENEFLRKLFIKFVKNIKSNYSNFDDFLQKDLSKDENGKESITKQFALSVKQNITKDDDEIKYTFGQMHFILSLANSKKTINNSPLLQEFVSFIKREFNGNILLSEKYLNEVSLIINNFRNKCAHPSKLNLDDAKECKIRIPKDIDIFINCKK